MSAKLWWAGSVLMAAAAAWTRGADMPTIRVTGDDTVIDRSCRVEIPEGTVIEDKGGDGVIQVRGSGITIAFAEKSVLCGAAKNKAADTFTGVGIRIDGQTDVTLRNIAVSGFHVGVHATNADRLLIEKSDGSGNRRARLRSTPLAEAGEDWIHPHEKERWLKEYGGA